MFFFFFLDFPGISANRTLRPEGPEERGVDWHQQKLVHTYYITNKTRIHKNEMAVKGLLTKRNLAERIIQGNSAKR